MSGAIVSHKPDANAATMAFMARWMRMFTLVEYRRAMGFLDSYILPSTRAESIHMLGNAVCPPVATAIINELRRVA